MKVLTLSFNSLQTGKPIQTKVSIDKLDGETGFQFPSNGKAHPNCFFDDDRFSGNGFNSLQTGKPIQTLPFWIQWGRGFAHPKTKHELRANFLRQK